MCTCVRPMYVPAAAAVAHMLLATLNTICTSLNVFFTLNRHCAAMEIAASSIACSGESCTTASRTKGKFSDIPPSPRGSATFSPELSSTAARNSRNSSHEPSG